MGIRRELHQEYERGGDLKGSIKASYRTKHNRSGKSVEHPSTGFRERGVRWLSQRKEKRKDSPPEGKWIRKKKLGRGPRR